MGRPKMVDELKRKARSISVRQEILDLAKGAKNTSVFFEDSVDACLRISEIVANAAGTPEERETAVKDAIASWSAKNSVKAEVEKTN